MEQRLVQIAEACRDAAEGGTMSFPEIVGTLIKNGFESYAVDFRRDCVIYYTADGDSVELPTHKTGVSVAAAFDATIVREAISQAQKLVPGYTYIGFCKKVAAAGCAGYIVSFSGRRALYFGRTAETHVEMFPQ